MMQEDKADLSKEGVGTAVQESSNTGISAVQKLAMNATTAAAGISSQKQRKEVKIDEELLSRQLVTFGMEYQKKISSLNVLIYGMRGIGAEVAKNLILSNVQSVTIVDNNVAVASDMGGNCFIREADVRAGKTRAQACLPNLRKVNSAVEVNLHAGEIHEAFLGEFNAVIFTDYYSREKLTTWNKVCRGKNSPFIFSGLLGLYGFCFLDFGDEHKITDADGTPPHQAFISHITNEQRAVVTFFEGSHMNLTKKGTGFQDGDMVVFTEVEGMDEINKLEPAEIKMLSPHCFEISIDTTEFSPYGCRGKVEQVRNGITQNFLNLEDSLRLGFGSNQTEFFVLDESKRGREDQLHQILQGIISYWDVHNQLPEQGKEDEIRQLIDAQNLKYKKTLNPLIVEELDRHLLRLICSYSQCQIAPLTTFWGGLIAAELLKSTGKFIPLPTWLHHHHLELLPQPTSRKQLPPRLNTRYDDYIQLFGNEFVTKSLNSKSLLVGAGALGSETLKMFALMGMGCHKRGCVNVADDDRVELSNLNRQVLAEREDIGETKAVIASSRAKMINSDINVRPMCAKIDSQSTKMFSDRFWKGIDYVICCVDNIASREYLDQQCVWYNKLLLESGTEGEKASCQIIIPQKTQSYVDSTDPTEQSFASCTLKFAPYLPEHCIAWASNFFMDSIVAGINEFIIFSKDPIGSLMKKKRIVFQSNDVKECVEVKQQLINIGRFARIWRNQKFEDCLRVARFFFDCAHKFSIESFLLTYPAEMKDRGGQPFWSGELRLPTLANLNIKDSMHAVWVESCARILAKSFNVTIPEKLDVTTFDFNTIAEDQIHPSLQIQPEFERTLKLADQRKQPDSTTPFSSQIQDLQMEVTALVDLVKDRIPKDQEQIKGINIEQQSQQYFDLLWAMTNIRARSYRIPESEKSIVKNITGKIVAALATTTAISVGTIGIELIKLINNMQLSSIRNSYMNVGQNIWVQQETIPPIQNFDKGAVKALPKGFTSWDSISVEGPIRVTQFRDFFLDKYDVLVQSIVTEGISIYDISQKNAQEQEQLDVQELYELAFQKKVPVDQLYLKFVITVLNRKNEVCVMPVVKYIYAGSSSPEEEQVLEQSASQALHDMEKHMRPGAHGSPQKQRKVESYLEDNVRSFLNELIIDALHEKPSDFLQFSCDWMQLQSTGKSFDLSNSQMITSEILNDKTHQEMQVNIKFLLEELVFDLVMKKPVNPREFTLKWFQQKKKQQRLHLNEEQLELPGKAPLSVHLTGVYVQDFQSYQTEYEEARKNLQEFESTNEASMSELQLKYEQYGLICIKFEKIPEAITYIKKSLFSLLKTPSKINSIEAARLYYLLAQLFDKQQQYLEAFRYYKEALWLQEQIFGEDRIENVEIMQKIGLILQRGRKYQCAHYNFAKSYEILKTNFNYECPNVIGSLINLANCLLDLRRADEAMSNYKRVLRMFERNDSMEPNIDNLNFLFNMSIATEQCRFFSESIKIMEEAFDLGQMFLPKGHPSLSKVQERIKTLTTSYPAAVE